jgi:Aspartyl protease
MKYCSLLFLLFICSWCIGQEDYIYTADGKTITSRRDLISDCLLSLKKDKTNKAALSICNCQADKLNFYFSTQQLKKFTKKNVIDLAGMIDADSVKKKQVQDCFSNSNKTALLQAEGFKDDMIKDCMTNIQKGSKEKADTSHIRKFCECQVEFIKNKKVSDSDLDKLSNENSAIYYEIIYNCGLPFSVNPGENLNWNENLEKDISGPAVDTIKVLSFNGDTYLRIKIGTTSDIWLFDTGASGFLITKEMEKQLTTEKILTPANYKGIGEYELANGAVDSCRKYIVNNIQIGKFKVNNITISVTDKGKKIIAGKNLFNKFKSLTLDNKNDLLILHK